MTTLVVDTSAAFAILTGEPGAAALREHLDRAQLAMMSTATLVELGMVLEARIGPPAPGVIERFIRDSEIDVVPLERPHVDRAMEGWRRFGKGRHPAKLNLGDCFAYGLAASTGHPVLCTGEDFAATDIEVVRPSTPPAQRF